MLAIEVEHLTKEFRLGAFPGLRQSLRNVGSRMMGKPMQRPQNFKALDNVSFRIEQGEVVGVIGHNGAGKSTLLKMLARISTPSSGRVKVHGRVAPLIEVGAGFVGEFTGRENVYLNGAILGMSRKEIDRKFDQIVDFADMAAFIDTPVKRYSSGMHVKLAFAVATSVDSEILIVDEVLAVGDIAFQRKCFDRMEQLIKREQRTVLLVSHNIRQVERLCSRVIVMDRGKCAFDDEPQSACNYFYLQSDRQIAENLRKEARSTPAVARNDDAIQLLDAQLLNSDRKPVKSAMYGGPCVLRLKFASGQKIDDLVVGIGVHTPDMLYIAIDDSILSPLGPQRFDAGEFVIEYDIAKLMLLPGSYAFRVGAAHAKSDLGVFYGENLCHFQVLPGAVSRTRLTGQGFFMLNGQWSVFQDAPVATADQAAGRTAAMGG